MAANRVIRDWTDSDNVNSLSVHAEVFFTRLIMKADDFGSYYGNPKLLKANLFPLRLDTVRDADISRWIAECEKAGLILIYTNAEKQYLRIFNFGQRLRSMKSKFPDPLTNDGDMQTIVSTMPPEVEVEDEEEDEGEGVKNANTHSQKEINSFQNFTSWIKINAPRVARMKKPFTIDQYLKIVKVLTKDVIEELLIAMENRADLHKKYQSAYLTLNKWSKMNFNSGKTEQNEQPTTDKRILQKLSRTSEA